MCQRRLLLRFEVQHRSIGVEHPRTPSAPTEKAGVRIHSRQFQPTRSHASGTMTRATTCVRWVKMTSWMESLFEDPLRCPEGLGVGCDISLGRRTVDCSSLRLRTESMTAAKKATEEPAPIAAAWSRLSCFAPKPLGNVVWRKERSACTSSSIDLRTQPFCAPTTLSTSRMRLLASGLE